MPPKIAFLPHLTAALAAFLLTSCAAPRSIAWDGTVAKRGDFQVQANSATSVPTAALKPVLDGLDKMLDKDPSLPDLRLATRAGVAAAVDRPGALLDLNAHIGLGWNLDVGYHYIEGSHGVGLRWQFLDDDWRAGIEALYVHGSWDPVGAERLGFKFQREDLVVPASFSIPFGESAKYGSFAMGPAVAFTWLRYGFTPTFEVKDDSDVSYVAQAIPMTRAFFWSQGGFVSLRAGYRKVFFLVGLSMWHTNYGTFKVPEQDPVHLEGITMVPSLGLELRL